MRPLYFSLILLVLYLFFSCKTKTESHPYTLHPKGFYYRLIAFDTKESEVHQGDIAHLDVEFATQEDSVFWDSYNNMTRPFFIKADSASEDFLSVYAATCGSGDSAELKMSPADFFHQRFQSDVPSACAKDSVVAIRFRLVSFFDSATTYLMSPDPAFEGKRITSFFGSESLAQSNLDKDGFYWVGKRAGDEKLNNEGEVIRIAYKGSFLNGRAIDQHVQEMEFELGTPDQVLPGLNYVIQRLKVGENAKIILPSRLAFGAQGSSDGRVPADMPLMYEVTLISK